MAVGHETSQIGEVRFLAEGRAIARPALEPHVEGSRSTAEVTECHECIGELEGRLRIAWGALQSTAPVGDQRGRSLAAGASQRARLLSAGAARVALGERLGGSEGVLLFARRQQELDRPAIAGVERQRSFERWSSQRTGVALQEQPGLGHQQRHGLATGRCHVEIRLGERCSVELGEELGAAQVGLLAVGIALHPKIKVALGAATGVLVIERAEGAPELRSQREAQHAQLGQCRELVERRVGIVICHRTGCHRGAGRPEQCFEAPLDRPGGLGQAVPAVVRQGFEAQLTAGITHRDLDEQGVRAVPAGEVNPLGARQHAAKQIAHQDLLAVEEHHDRHAGLAAQPQPTPGSLDGGAQVDDIAGGGVPTGLVGRRLRELQRMANR